jgi:hypothetical protein
MEEIELEKILEDLTGRDVIYFTPFHFCFRVAGEYLFEIKRGRIEGATQKQLQDYDAWMSLQKKMEEFKDNRVILNEELKKDFKDFIFQRCFDSPYLRGIRYSDFIINSSFDKLDKNGRIFLSYSFKSSPFLALAFYKDKSNRLNVAFKNEIDEVEFYPVFGRVGLMTIPMT